MRVLAAVCLFVVIVFLLPFVVKTQYVTCVSQYGACSQESEDTAKGILGVSIKSSGREIINRFDRLNSVETVGYEYAPPATFKINVIEKKGEIAVREQGSDKFKILSYSSETIGESDSSLLPKVIIENSEFTASSKEVNFAASLLRELSKYYSIEELTLRDHSLYARYQDRINLVFPLDGDVDILLGSLELLLFQLNQAHGNSKIDGTGLTSVNEIDLRYDNPVIK